MSQGTGTFAVEIRIGVVLFKGLVSGEHWFQATIFGFRSVNVSDNRDLHA